MDTYYIQDGIIKREEELDFDELEELEEVYFCETMQKWRYVNCEQ